MFTVLIPSLKSGFLRSQLYWLSKQEFKDFTVIVMDSRYKENRYHPWTTKKYPFQFHHVPLIHNVMMAKRHDFSLKNNLALLAPTDYFIFLSDSHYIPPTFTADIARHLLYGNQEYLKFEAVSVLSRAYDQYNHTLDLGGELEEPSAPSWLFSRRLFFYFLNGFNEATTYSYAHDDIDKRMTIIGRRTAATSLYHIEHADQENDFGDRWLKPCERCKNLFAPWKFDQAMIQGDFAYGNADKELIDQMTFADPDLGLLLFQCSNCGFGGIFNPAEYERMQKIEQWTGAPKKVLDAGVGRDLSKVYEEITTKVNFNIQARMAFLKTTY